MADRSEHGHVPEETYSYRFELSSRWFIYFWLHRMRIYRKGKKNWSRRCSYQLKLQMGHFVYLLKWDVLWHVNSATLAQCQRQTCGTLALKSSLGTPCCASVLIFLSVNPDRQIMRAKQSLSETNSGLLLFRKLIYNPARQYADKMISNLVWMGIPDLFQPLIFFPFLY